MMQKPTGGQAIVRSPRTGHSVHGFRVRENIGKGSIMKWAARIDHPAETFVKLADSFGMRTREVSPWGLLMAPAKRNDR
jgi:hypothetical protein